MVLRCFETWLIGYDQVTGHAGIRSSELGKVKCF